MITILFKGEGDDVRNGTRVKALHRRLLVARGSMGLIMTAQ